MLLWQQSGSQISFELTSVWAAEAVNNRYGKLLDGEIEMIKQQVQATTPFLVTGEYTDFDRTTDACQTFAAALRSALCTDVEIEAWQRGEPFKDPWPTSVREMP